MPVKTAKLKNLLFFFGISILFPLAGSAEEVEIDLEPETDRELPLVALLDGGDLVEEDTLNEQTNPYYTLSWAPVEGFEKVERKFLPELWNALTDWSLPDPDELEPDYEFQVERADNAAFDEARQIYQGWDLSSVISGMEEGEHYFRVRTVDRETGETSEWSASLGLAVEFPSRTRAFSLFAIGFLVTGITIATILIGAKRTANERND